MDSKARSSGEKTVDAKELGDIFRSLIAESPSSSLRELRVQGTHMVDNGSYKISVERDDVED